MREKFAEVLSLQLQHSSENTPSMERRGRIIRNEIPNEMRDWQAAKSSAALPFKGRLNVQGRDGTGRKTFIPWVRIHSPDLSPSAQSGWYVVYLFHADGNGVSLCLMHGSTRFDGSDFKPRSAQEAAALMTWARGLVGPEASALGFREGADLGSRETLARAYERTTAYSKRYSADNIPMDDVLAKDAAQAVSLLGQLYRAAELGRSPDAEAPEVLEAKNVIQQLARPQQAPQTGQGFALSQPEKRAIEERAMSLAEAWLIEQGYESIADVSLNQSCDFRAVKDGDAYVVEVKGTTGGFGNVLLTANEVELHRREHPHNILIVVHDIDLIEMRHQATGGKLVVMESWNVDAYELKALSYSCALQKR